MTSYLARLGLVVLLASTALAVGDRADNRTYVASGPDSLYAVFYARCTPAGRSGTEGRTEIFRVDAAGDTKLDTFDIFPPGGVCLGWSPIAGKVAVLAVMLDGGRGTQPPREELRLFLGGEKLESYTAADLVAMGAKQVVSSAYGARASYRIIGCEQIPGTNEYDFVLALDDGKTLRFDIVTGKLREAATTRPASR